jgi:photosystem II stability/assembly factor-like uncharacterized protein
MKGPKDPTKRARKRSRPAGGKVLQRLALFDQARGFDFGLEAIAPPAAVMAVPRPAAELETLRAAPMTEQMVGQLYAETARALTIEQRLGPPPVLRTLAPPSEAPEAPAALVAPASWRLIGPTMVPGGQTYGESRPIVSGRVSAVAVDPSNSSHVLCGSAAGGVWETRDAGITWAPRTDDAPTLTVGALTFDPSNPTTAYCGTGEGNFYRSLGAGVLRSQDGGTTWTTLAAAPFIGQGFHDLLVDPASSNHLLAATTGGLYESLDGGQTWAQRRPIRTWDVALVPGEALAACEDGLFRSTDGGSTWAVVALPGALFNWNRLAADIAPSNTKIAYAFGASGGRAFLYKRNEAGNWRSISPPTGLDVGQAWYDWFLAVAPDNPAQIYLGAIEAYRGDASGNSWSWITISNKGGDDIHPDQHAIAIDPSNPNVIYVGCDGGLFRSPDRGMKWISLNPGLAITEIEYIAQDLGSARWLIGGTQDNGSVRYTGDLVWDHVADGDGGDCAVNSTLPNIVFHSYYGMGMERSFSRADFGSFAGIGPHVPQGYQALFYPPMESMGDTLAQAGQSVFLSRNQGNQWSEIKLPGNPTASAMHMPTTDRLYVGTIDGRLFRIDWSGASWSPAKELTRPRFAWMSDIFADPADPNRLWVTFTTLAGGRIFRSDDGGATWQDKSAGLPNLPINAVEVDPTDKRRVWVAADLGIYQTLDEGDAWAGFSNDLPNVLVADLLFHPYARLLRAGTRNRGVWEIAVDGLLESPACGTQWTGSLGPNETKIWHTHTWPATWHVLWTVMPTTPGTGVPQIQCTTRVERTSAEFADYWIIVANLTAQAVDFEGRYAILGRF